MNKIPVYFLPAYSNSSRGLVKSLTPLLEQSDLSRTIAEKDLVAVKVHFGEPGNQTFLRPEFVRRIADFLVARKARPFLTDTNTLYVGARTNSAQHLVTALRHGFDFSAAGAPLVIADGLRGNAGIKVSLPPPVRNREVTVAPEIYSADALVLATHFKGHEAFGFGGSLKNLGMGCTNRAGKLFIHATIAPSVFSSACVGCGTCLKWCGYQAISVRKKKAQIDAARCVGCAECISACPHGAVEINWAADSPSESQKRLAEVARGVALNKGGKLFCLNFLINITPNCDCFPFSEPPIVSDLGVLASTDPVAIDQASIDLVNRAEALPGSGLKSGRESGGDKFRGLHPRVPYELQLEWAEKIGLGQRAYQLIKVKESPNP
ncbi:MAG: DUF362 domain-containing protein [bacterium]|nr:DUF362 domain-containing protein [bacterium]